jgi:predicted nucleic acid-binding protein
LRRDWVVDASVAIKLFVVEDLAWETASFFTFHADRVFVPDFFYVECSNILWKYVWRFGHSPEKARKSLVELRRMDLYPTSPVPFLSPAFDLALQHHLSVYDATYVTLAQGMGLPFMTADGKLIRKLKGSGTDIHWVGDLPA